jgi:IS30 family transposase
VPHLSEVSSKPRKYARSTVQQKEEFFRVFDRLRNASDAAAELGLNRNTCYQWIRKAGLARKRSERPTREDFFRLRQSGVSRRDAARTLGIHRTTADEWDTGIRRTQNGRIYPSGRAVDYNNGVTTTIPATGIGMVPLPALEQAIDERYLSIKERETIRDLLTAGKSRRKIAEALGRSVSTVSREIARNSDPEGGYHPYAAHRAAASRRPRPKDSKLAAEGRLRTYVKDKLRIRWSPEQISHTLIKEFPDDPEMRVSHETVYQALYVQARGGLKREVQAALRTGRTRRKARNNAEQRRSRFVDPMVNISERPPEVQDRAVPGHWESQCFCQAA